jgi:hypothetical protein
MDTYQVEKTFNLGNDVNDQQLGCLWQGNDLITISLRGDLIFLDEANPIKPKKVSSIYSLSEWNGVIICATPGAVWP